MRVSSMKVRDLERLLVSLGAPSSFLDTVTRVLRSKSRLPIGGRGAHAPDIGPDEAAWIILALAGTDVAARAVEGLARLLDLQLPTGERARFATSFVDAIQVILGSPESAAQIREVRVGRSHALSQIIYCDGEIERFVLPGTSPSSAAEVGSTKFRSEAVLTGGLLVRVAQAVIGDD